MTKRNHRRPKLNEGEHPLENGDYLIGTRVIDEAYEAIFRIVKTRSPGGIFVGPQRFGKSYAIKYLSYLLQQVSSIKPAVFCIFCKYHPSAISDGRFYEEILVSLGHAYTKSGTPQDKSKRITEYLYEEVSSSPNKTLILFFDDAHRLSRHQYEWLIDIYNELDRLTIKPFFLFFGQPELSHMRNSFIQSHQKQIIGRFMSREHAFHGITNADDISVFLESFDGVHKGTDYPLFSGWCYTRYYFTNAYEEGWRFSALSQLIWEAFSLVRKKYSLTSDFEIPMQYLCTTLEFLYVNYSDLYSVPPVINKETIEQAIYNSGYIESELSFILTKDKQANFA